ncbi:MAG: hypothetical protein ACE5KZ_16060 [Candidatus Scalinduaceae bacterium]
MQRKFHLLNSPKYFSISEEYGLFGVSERNLNQLANIWKGDIVFYYTAHKVGLRTSGFIHGPFEITSELFYNDKIVWTKDKNNADKDKYPYRIKFEYLREHICLNPIPIQIFWDLKEEGKIKTVIDSSALIDKAVTTLLDEEGILLLQALLQENPKSGKYTKKYKGHNYHEEEIDLLKFKGSTIKEFVMEAYLEAYLLRNPEVIHNLSGFENGLDENYRYDILNQVSTYIAGGAIDVVCLYKKKVLDMWLAINATVFELKKGIIDPFFIDQLIRYIEWTSRLIPGAKHRMIKGILIGRDFGNQTEMKNALKKRVEDVKGLYSIDCYTYSVKNDRLVFNSLED